MFAIGAIILSLIALLSYARYRDGQLGRTNSRLAHFYIAPAMLALAILTFYPVMYGFWLSFTDADQTRLGEQVFHRLGKLLGGVDGFRLPARNYFHISLDGSQCYCPYWYRAIPGTGLTTRRY